MALDRVSSCRRAAASRSGRAPLLLSADQRDQFVVEGDERLAFHLVVAVTQVRSAAVVGDDAVEWQLERVGHAQAAADQDDGDQPVGGFVLAGEVGLLADRGQEQADRADVGAVLGSAPEGCVEVGEVGLEHGPAQAVHAGDAAGMQEGGEPGQDAHWTDASGFQPEAGAQPPTDPALGSALDCS